ncbi:hypothetical protein BASA83_013461 [Batrachochytrium salamandrivorans]|nr:hypothetical protein BASA83_013461 [Batrachochytrium salamandrivorans]
MRSTDSDRSVCVTPKKAREASPPPQDDLWVVVKNLSQQVAAQQAKLDALRNAFALQQKTSAELVDQMKSTGEATQTVLAAILARLEAGPVVPQVVVVDNDYPPLLQTGATPKRKTMATKPNSNIATTNTTSTTTDQPSKDTRFADAVKKRLTHQQLVERQPDFCKAGACCLARSETRDFSPCTQCTESGALLGSPTHLCKRIPIRKAWRPSKGNTGSSHPYKRSTQHSLDIPVSLDATIVKSFKAWTPRSEAADKDKLAAILSFAAKTVTTIQRKS